MTLRGVYLLADESVMPFAQWAEHLVPCLSAGVVLVQYRAKQQGAASQQAHARCLLEWCRQARVPMLVNDDVALAQKIGADGVHVGASDTAVAQARVALGADALIGSSCYDDVERARAMRDAGANYVSFGRLFGSQTKPDAPPAALHTLTLAQQTLNTRICAIGGIQAENAQAVLQAGADLLCVGGGILRQPDPHAATRKLATIAAAAFAQRSLQP